MTELKLMAYNIWRGFHSKTNEFEQARMKAAQIAVGREKPDILMLTEAQYGGNSSAEKVMHYRDIFGFQYYYFASHQQQESAQVNHGGNAILSRLPMQAFTFDLAHRPAARAAVQVNPDTRLQLDVVHPSLMLSEKERIAGLVPLVRTMEKPYIMAGDFNALSPHDQYDRKVVLEEFPKFSKTKALASDIDEMLNCEQMRWLFSQGLRDTMPAENRRATVPTKAKYRPRINGLRFDFILSSNDVNVINSYVVANSDTEEASDHRPVVSIIKL